MEAWNIADVKIYLDDYELDGLLPFKTLGADTFIMQDSYLQEISIGVSPSSYTTYKMLYNESLGENTFRLRILHKANEIVSAICRVEQCSKMCIGGSEHPISYYRLKFVKRLPI